MSRYDRRSCPPWCVADHADEDDPGTARHRSQTVVVPGISIRSGERRTVESIEILIELHAEEGDPVVGVYIGDGHREGLDITTETADRLVRALIDALRTARPYRDRTMVDQATRAAPNNRPSA
jgi:hypothetical protein